MRIVTWPELFFSNYFLMFNRLFEDWFAEALGIPLSKLHQEWKMGIPFVNTQVAFKKASRIDDILGWGLAVRTLGTKSLTLDVSACCDGEERIVIEATLVSVDLIDDGVASREIPACIRAAMEAFRTEPPVSGLE